MQLIPSGELFIDRKERANLPFQDLDLRPASERICDFDEVVLPFDEERAKFEASRCIHCPDPAPCVTACPVNNDIPSAMWLIEQGQFLEAAELYRQTSSMPEICGRVCPHEQLCQGSCVQNHYEEPVQTGALESFVTDYARRMRGETIETAPSTGRKIAIVGAGPSGLACAEQLLVQGHSVTVFDKQPQPGGLLMYGIPNFKLEKDVLRERVDILFDAGMQFQGSTTIGKDKTIDELFNEGYEAVYVAVGTWVDSPMDVPGEDLPGVHKGTPFLIRNNVDPQYLPEDMQTPDDVGKKVVVIGGGDTASDCLRTACRMGAEEVTCVYRRTENEMPGGAKDRKMARQEGTQYSFLTQPVEFIAGEDGRLAALECVKMELGEPDDSGRRRPVPIEGSNFRIEADTAILALGYWPDELIGKSTPNLETHKWGLIVTDPETGATSRPGVFAGGDAVTGPDLVVTATVAGRKAAQSINQYLKSKLN
ncbi:MAG: NAD(P)-dependent oxidoreductase [Chloroflexi bacterium]|nr:MAG: NAD(P)-dependent oxidoreductase [Chloroflexota bacterium]MBL1193242.1 NAD(P)-dependent oxidoreductase [Chloroflexota bacterium]NOH10537.1 NAD(P)-dependent oxidoreductase [Chloroflexota bacterium]